MQNRVLVSEYISGTMADSSDENKVPYSVEDIKKLCKPPTAATKVNEIRDDIFYKKVQICNNRCFQDFIMQQTMLRIKDPRISIPFYTEVLGMTLLCKLDFPVMSFSLYFVGYEDGTAIDAEIDTTERAEWAMSKKATIELTQ